MPTQNEKFAVRRAHAVCTRGGGSLEAERRRRIRVTPARRTRS